MKHLKNCDMANEMKLYVKVNHKNMISIDRKIVPNLYKFCQDNIDDMMNVLQQDIDRVKAYEKETKKKDVKTDKSELSIQVPIYYVKKDEWDHLATGINIKPVVAMTLCFGGGHLLCDIRWDPNDMKRHQLKKMSEGTHNLDKNPEVVVPTRVFSMPKFKPKKNE
jgi:hypothetical protein